MVEVVVEFEYISHEDDELTIKPGDIIKDVVKMDGGWWEGVLNGKRGMFPDNFVKEIKKEKSPSASKKTGSGHVSNLAKNLSQGGIKMGPPPTAAKAENKHQRKKILAKVTFAYTPQHDDELALAIGDIIEVTKQEEEGWWEGIKKGTVGVFPSNFVELIRDESIDEDGDFREIKGKKVKGVGLGNIFEDGPIKLKSANREDSKEETRPEPKSEPRKDLPQEPKVKKNISPAGANDPPALPPKEIKEPKPPSVAHREEYYLSEMFSISTEDENDNEEVPLEIGRFSQVRQTPPLKRSFLRKSGSRSKIRHRPVISSQDIEDKNKSPLASGDNVKFEISSPDISCPLKDILSDEPFNADKTRETKKLLKSILSFSDLDKPSRFEIPDSVVYTALEELTGHARGSLHGQSPGSSNNVPGGVKEEENKHNKRSLQRAQASSSHARSELGTGQETYISYLIKNGRAGPFLKHILERYNIGLEGTSWSLKSYLSPDVEPSLTKDTRIQEALPTSEGYCNTGTQSNKCTSLVNQGTFTRKQNSQSLLLSKQTSDVKKYTVKRFSLVFSSLQKKGTKSKEILSKEHSASVGVLPHDLLDCQWSGMCQLDPEKPQLLRLEPWTRNNKCQNADRSMSFDANQNEDTSSSFQTAASPTNYSNNTISSTLEDHDECISATILSSSSCTKEELHLTDIPKQTFV